ncbi:SCO family protein [Muricoccus vinaceus]|uniref:SCO family protein n=1 Tax=Muricoccus vinaceus TaxID=424704 RepID=A0ABV6IXL4_9PROT
MNPISRRRALVLLGAASALAAAPPALAHEGHAAPAVPLPPAAGATDRLRGPLPDARVVDASQRRRRLVSEVIGRRVVAIDFVLTDCSTVCSIISAGMAGAQSLLGPRLAGEAGLLSLALDPIGGTPEELARYARRFGAGPGWDFVNLPPASLDLVLRRLGGPAAGNADHAPMVVVLDPLRGELRRLPGMPGAEAIAAAVEAALAARTQA